MRTEEVRFSDLVLAFVALALTSLAFLKVETRALVDQGRISETAEFQRRDEISREASPAQQYKQGNNGDSIGVSSFDYVNDDRGANGNSTKPKILTAYAIETRRMNETILGNHDDLGVHQIGFGLPWQDLADKVKYTGPLIKKIALEDPNHLVLLLDTDTVVTCSATEIAEHYKAISEASGSKIVFSVEYCFGGCEERCEEVPRVPEWAEAHNPSLTTEVAEYLQLDPGEEVPRRPTLRSLNSGGIIGPARYIHDMYETVWRDIEGRREYIRSDQPVYYAYFLDHKDIVTLDYEMRIFTTLCDLDVLKVIEKKKEEEEEENTQEEEKVYFYNKLSKRKACVLHFDAAKKWNSSAVTALLGRKTADIALSQPCTDYGDDEVVEDENGVKYDDDGNIADPYLTCKNKANKLKQEGGGGGGSAAGERDVEPPPLHEQQPQIKVLLFPRLKDGDFDDLESLLRFPEGLHYLPQPHLFLEEYDNDHNSNDNLARRKRRLWMQQKIWANQHSHHHHKSSSASSPPRSFFSPILPRAAAAELISGAIATAVPAHLYGYPIGKNLVGMGLTLFSLLPRTMKLTSGVAFNIDDDKYQEHPNPWLWSRVKGCQLRKNYGNDEDDDDGQDDIRKSWGCYFELLDDRTLDPPMPSEEEKEGNGNAGGGEGYRSDDSFFANPTNLFAKIVDGNTIEGFYDIKLGPNASHFFDQPNELQEAYLAGLFGVAQAVAYAFKFNNKTREHIDNIKSMIRWPARQTPSATSYRKAGETNGGSGRGRSEKRRPIIAGVHLRRGDVAGFNCSWKKWYRSCVTMQEIVEKLDSEAFRDYGVTHVYLSCENKEELALARKLAPQ